MDQYLPRFVSTSPKHSFSVSFVRSSYSVSRFTFLFKTPQQIRPHSGLNYYIYTQTSIYLFKNAHLSCKFMYKTDISQIFEWYLKVNMFKIKHTGHSILFQCSYFNSLLVYVSQTSSIYFMFNFTKSCHIYL